MDLQDDLHNDLHNNLHIDHIIIYLRNDLSGGNDESQ